MKKRLLVLIMTVFALSSVLAACAGGKTTTTTTKKEGFKVAMVTDTGGIDDKSFNQSAWEGLKKFGKDNNLQEKTGYKYLQSTSASDYAPNLNSLIREKYSLVYGIGYLMENDVKKVATQNKDANLAIVDTVVKDDNGKPMKNVASIVFKEQEGSFLTGVIAGLQTKTNKVGFVGGIEGDVIKRFENGFKAGVKAVNPNAEIIVQYAQSFSDATKGQAIANAMYGSGADIIFHAAGAAGNGVFTEAKNRKKNNQNVWVVGVDRDQYQEGLPEDVTLTSMVKRVNNAVYDVTKQAKDGKFPGGKVIQYGLKEDGVGISDHKEHVTPEALKSVDEYATKIKNGDIKVPGTDDEYKQYLTTIKK